MNISGDMFVFQLNSRILYLNGISGTAQCFNVHVPYFVTIYATDFVAHSVYYV